MKIINYHPAAIEQEISNNKRNVFKFFARYSLDVLRAFFIFSIFALLLFVAFYLTYENAFLLSVLRITAISSCVLGILTTIVFFASDDGPCPEDFRKWFHRYASKRKIICVYRTNYGKTSRLEFALENPDGSIHYAVSPVVSVTEYASICSPILDLFTGTLKIPFEDHDTKMLGKPTVEADVNENR